jgi:glutathione S-transferase
MIKTTVPRLYHAPSSYYSMIARLAFAEGRVAHESVFVDIHVRMSQQQPDYVRLNPNMTVATLVLADRVLDQSRDIAEYALGACLFSGGLSAIAG